MRLLLKKIAELSFLLYCSPSFLNESCAYFGNDIVPQCVCASALLYVDACYRFDQEHSPNRMASICFDCLAWNYEHDIFYVDIIEGVVAYSRWRH